MKIVSTESIRMQDLECEFIPPLDLPEVYRIPWDQQLRAASAWQMAGGNLVDGIDQPDAAQQPWLLADRRRQAVMINFPDRRLAA